MKDIIFGFSRPKSKKPFAEAIMAYDETNFDHGYTKYILDQWKRDIIYQSSGIRTNFMGGEYFRSINIEVEEYMLEIDDDIAAVVGATCVDREGRPYPIKMILGIGLVRTAAMIKISIKNPWPSELRNCIGEQAYILANCLDIDCPLDLNEATPKEFRDWIRTIRGIKRIK